MAYFVHTASLAGLPAELFDDVCSRLSRHTLTLLARTCKEINQKIQDLLYYHASIRGFIKLSFFLRTLGDAARYDRRGDVTSKHVHDLKLILDPKKEAGDRTTAVVLGKIINGISRYCPKIRIHLVLENASCSGQPIASFFQETFPRVTTLVLNTGPGAPPTSSAGPFRPNNIIFNSRTRRESLGANMRDTSCRPNKDFWTGIFNGNSFPALEEVEINHLPYHNSIWGAPIIQNSELKGLRNITRLVVDKAPELNGVVLMSALQCAPSLKHLELKNIDGLEYDVLAKLIVFALPNLNHFTLHVSHGNVSATNERDGLHGVDPLEATDPTVPPIHLCPLIREHSKNIPYLDLFLPYVCREMFLSPNERLKLHEAGIHYHVAGRWGEKGEDETLDYISTLNVVTEYRKALSQARLQAAVKQNIAEAKAAGNDKVVTMAEYEEQQKLFARTRMIEDHRWRRILRCGQRLCRNNEAWEELGVLARLDEENMEWHLGNVKLNLGGIFIGQGIGIEQHYDDLFKAEPGSEEAARVQMLRGAVRDEPDGYDHNDDQM